MVASSATTTMMSSSSVFASSFSVPSATSSSPSSVYGVWKSPQFHRQFTTSRISSRFSLTHGTTVRSTAFGGGGGGNISSEIRDFGGGGGGDGSDGGGVKVKVVSASGDDVAASEADVIVLHVTGMTCGGCSSSVKRILESQPQVSSADVDLATETAVIWPKSEAKEVEDWKKQIGEALAKHLTNCGFESSPQGPL